MSMKNDYLLQCSGRDQFGNKGSSNLIRAPKKSRQDKLCIEQHEKLNDAFLKKFSADWLGIFDGFSKKEIHKKLFPYGRPALSTFYKNARDFKKFDDYMLFLLLQDKRRYLSVMGVKKEDIEAEISKFEDCGRHGVAYKGIGMIFTS